MATFKVGQQVKYVSGIIPQIPIGTIGTVVGPADIGYRVDFPLHRPALSGFLDWGVYPTSIVPLVDDSAADAFLARIKSLKPYEEPVVPRVVIHEGNQTVDHDFLRRV